MLAHHATVIAAPNVEYEVRIQAVGSLGAGDFSNATVFRTSEDGKVICSLFITFFSSIFYQSSQRTS